ncbi:MAG: ABC transporter ATP-binding protein [Sphaerochaetaceae bacterium]|jgi:iron complex transport system ATP-binding protein
MILDIQNLSFRYKHNLVIQEIEFTAEKGSLVAILGRNGAGKTTLLKCINHVLKSQTGTVLIEGIDTKTLRPLQLARKIGWVPQSGEISLMNVFDLVLLGRKPHFTWAPTKEDYQKVEEALTTIGIKSLALRPANQLSGGEFQQVQIARALAQDPKVILFDEPTSSLDIHNQYRLMSTIQMIIRQSSRLAVMAVHDLNMALRYCDKFILLKEGKVFACGGTEVITPSSIEAVYDIKTKVVEVENYPIVVPAK